MALPGGPEINQMNDRFNTANTKIVVEVVDEKTPIVIDLGKAP